MNSNLLKLTEQILPQNYHYLDIPLFHVSKENFNFPKIEFINSHFKKNEHHIKSAMGLWTCNNDFVISDLEDSFFQYECIMKPETKWSVISYYNFKKIFQLFEEHAFNNNLNNSELSIEIFNFYKEIRQNYDVLILSSYLEPKEQNTLTTSLITQSLAHRKEEIIILNLDMISEWKLTNKKTSKNKNSP